MRVRLAPQVIDFVRGLAPEPRRRLRSSLRDLAHGKGDIKALDGPLQDYCRLRVGPYRVLFSYAKGRTIDGVFTERRTLVYEVFAQEMIERLIRLEQS
jgi:mRNA-degrading endonuclease RelE of RelBE toxin-antitoxin system